MWDYAGTLSDRVTVVTGGAGGIGSAICEVMSGAGARGARHDAALST